MRNILIVENLLGKEDILTIQLIENLQRENLNPIDEAGAYLSYMQNTVGEGKAFKIADIDKLMTELKAFYDILEQVKAGGGIEKAESKPAANKLA